MPVIKRLNSFHEFFFTSILLASDGERLRAFLVETRAVGKLTPETSRAELS